MNKDQASSGRCPTCGQGLDEGSFGGVCPACAFGRILGEPEVIEGGEKRPNAGREGVAEVAGALRPGDRIGAYKILEEIGEGGCGKVYVAEQEQPVRRRVALKVIKLGMDTREVIGRFEAERQALAMMDHPNIAKVLDAGSTDTGRPFFVMELVKGIRITDYCDRNSVSTEERLRLFIQVCQAIQHAHQKGIIHRDIKPANILVTLHDGVAVPKVIDFGIAKATSNQRLTDKTVYTAMLQFVGTPAYMSPEQAELSGLDIDTRSDIYALGVLLYELLTGCTPFDTRRLAMAGIDEVRRIIRDEDPPRPSTKISTLAVGEQQLLAKRRQSELPRLLGIVRGDLDWVVMKALEKDRRRRYDTAAGLATDVQRYLRDEPVVARPPTLTYQLGKAIRRNRRVFTAVGGVVAALVLGLVATAWQAVRATQAEREQAKLRESAEQAVRRETGAREAAVKAGARAEEARASEAEQRQRADLQTQEAVAARNRSRRLLYAADMNLAQQALEANNLGKARRLLDRHRPSPGLDDLRGWEWRYLWRLSRGGSFLKLTERASAITKVSFSKDGRQLLAVWSDGAFEFWDVRARRRLENLALTLPSGAVPFSFLPAKNGFVLGYTNSTATVIAIHDSDTHRTDEILTLPDPANWQIYDFSLSRDNSRLLVQVRGITPATNSIWVVDMETKSVSHRVWFPSRTWERVPPAAISHDNRRLYHEWSEPNINGYVIRCTDLAANRKVWDSPRQSSQTLSAIALSADGKILATAAVFAEQDVNVWNSETGEAVARLAGHTSSILGLQFPSSGRFLLSAGGDQTIRIWNLNNWALVSTLRGHSDEVNVVDYSDDQQLLASGSKSGELLLWDLNAQAPEGEHRILPKIANKERLLPLGPSTALLLPPGLTAYLIDLALGDSVARPADLAISDDILGVFGTNTVCVWNGSGRVLLYQFSERGFQPSGSILVDSELRPSAFTYDPNLQIAAWALAGSSASIRVSTMARPDGRSEFISKFSETGLIKTSPDGKWVVAVNKKGQGLRVWEIETGAVAMTLDTPISAVAFARIASLDGRVSAVEFAHDGRILSVLADHQGGHEILLFDLLDPSHKPKSMPGLNFSEAQAVSPDGGLIVSTTWSGHVRFVDTRERRLIEEIRGNMAGTHDVAFSPDGARLISTSWGREAVTLWDPETRQEVLTLRGSGGPFHNTFWTNDGNVIVAGTRWQLWRAPSWEEIAAAEGRGNN
ncbi:MAG: protein kinase [Verrucomicrobiales bacterium]|nr:protein kinase [Verrucomicrobiales bacterium]